MLLRDKRRDFFHCFTVMTAGSSARGPQLQNESSQTIGSLILGYILPRPGPSACGQPECDGGSGWFVVQP